MKFFSLTKNIAKRFCISKKISQIPDIRTFLSNTSTSQDKLNTIDDISEINFPNQLSNSELIPKEKKYFLETYGCQMNTNDSEIISSIMEKQSYLLAEDINQADVILVNTCAIREKAEEKVLNRLQHLKGIKKRNPDVIVGILGCMAERMKSQLLEKSESVDIIAGPDSYRDLPNMIKILETNSNPAVNVQLSLDETYADIIPVRKSGNKAYISIMRGCNNMCSFCIVPFTRGRERSREFESILDEVKILRDNGCKEITLLGQNVNSYLDTKYEGYLKHQNSKGFSELFKLRDKKGLRFSSLLEQLSQVAPEVRFRFTSPHPKDFPDDLIQIISESKNICKQIHMPAQSGNSDVLKRMRRLYSREAYIELVDSIRKTIPKIAISSDFIAGFCGETDDEFKDTLKLIEEVKYDMAYLYAYSMRDRTHAYHNYEDNVTPEIKASRLSEMINVFKENQLFLNKKEVNSYHIVLVEGYGKYQDQLFGKTDTNKNCVFYNKPVSKNHVKFLNIDQHFFINNKKEIIEGKYQDLLENENDSKVEVKLGDLIIMKVNSVSNNTIFGTMVCKTDMKLFSETSNNNPYFFLENDDPDIFNDYNKISFKK